MPDLIIKPAAQSGNKVIIQDQAGGAVITTADSGATIADGIALGTPASGVVTNLSGVLPAGVTGGSGLTALGTVASGNLSNTGIVYPAGHMRYLSTSGLSSINNTSVSTHLMSGNGLSTGTFTAGSRILVVMMIGGTYRNTDNTGGYGQGYITGTVSSTGTATDSGLGLTNSGGSSSQVFVEFGYFEEAGSTGSGISAHLLVTPINGCTSATYNCYYHENTDQQMYFYNCRMMLWEVFS